MKRIRKSLLAILCVCFLTGCWNKRELNQIAIVSAVGFDLNKDGQLVGTFQIINPDNVAGALQGGGGQNPSTTIYGSAGGNMMELDSRTSGKISRDMYFAHANLIVFSEKLARDHGFNRVLDTLERSPEFRTTTRVIIARDGKASDTVETLTAIDKVNAEKIIHTMENAEKRGGRSYVASIQQIVKNLETPGREPFIAGFRTKGDKKKGDKMDNIQSSDPEVNLEAAGLAIFKDGRLIGWLDGAKARGTVWIFNRVRNGDISIKWKNKKEAIAYHLLREKTKIKAYMKNGKPAILITIRAEGDIREADVPIDLSNPDNLPAIEDELSKTLKKQIEETVQEVQKKKTDIFGFGERIYRSYPNQWKKLDKNWNDEGFTKLEVNVDVETFIRRTGLRNEPFMTHEK